MKTEEFPIDVLDKVIQHPVTSHALLQILIDNGVKLNCDHTKLNHMQRITVLYQIVDEMKRRENPQ